MYRNNCRDLRRGLVWHSWASVSPRSEGGTAVAGLYGTVVVGDWGVAEGGDQSMAMAGDDGTAIVGRHGIALVRRHGLASAGEDGIALVGRDGGDAMAGHGGIAFAGWSGRAKAGERGVVMVRYREGRRHRVAVGYVGEEGIKADTWYAVEGGKLVEDTSEAELDELLEGL